MPSFEKYVGNIRRLYLFSDDARMSLEMLDRCIRNNRVNPKVYEMAILEQSPDLNDDNENPDNYTLKFYSKKAKEELWIAGVAASEYGPDSHGTLQCLLLMGFKVDAEKDIFQLPIGMQKLFYKEGTNSKKVKKRWGKKSRI